jgi:starvation-inducible DNA-binding protein
MSTATTANGTGTEPTEGTAPSSDRLVELLQGRLVALLDLHLTLKHVHWNVTGANFIAVHEMLDPQVDKVRAMSDAVAERIATCGGVPRGTPGAIVELREWDDYGIERAPTQEHLEQLVSVYAGVITDHRAAAEEFAELDPVSEDLLIGQLAELELFAWFIRSHLGR